MKFLVEENEQGQKAYETILVKNPKLLSVLNNELALRIIQELGKQPSCPMDVARKLKQHEQKIYYHIRKLENLGLIKLMRKEERVGATAKIYAPVSPVVSFKLFEGEHINDVKTKVSQIKFLEPFIRAGKLNSLIVVGSPDPHGKYRTPASDGYCAINLGMFLGQFVNDLKIPYYKLDTQVTESDLEKNLILIGGPKANIITERINKDLPIYFNYSKELLEWNIVSTVSKTVYRQKHIGFIVRIKNPFAEGKEILLFSGNGFRGTTAAVLTFTNHLREVQKGNANSPEIIAKVVQGVDMDSDGIVDDVEFLE